MQGAITSRVSSEPFRACYGDGQVNRPIRQNSLLTMMFADEIVICSMSRRPWRGGDVL